LRDLNAELITTTKKARGSGLNDQETNIQSSTIRGKYIEMMKGMLPEAMRLQEACKKYIKNEVN
jgi:hypothetical protein